VTNIFVRFHPNLDFPENFTENSPKNKFPENMSVESDDDTLREDGRAEVTNLTGALREYAKASKNGLRFDNGYACFRTETWQSLLNTAVNFSRFAKEETIFFSLKVWTVIRCSMWAVLYRGIYVYVASNVWLHDGPLSHCSNHRQTRLISFFFRTILTICC